MPSMLTRLRKCGVGIVSLFLFAAVGCDHANTQNKSVSTNVAGVSVPIQNPLGYLNVAQPKLPTLKLYVGTKEIVAELARKHVEIQTGMMHRDSLGEDEGMLFIFSVPMRTAFYMRNTKVPLTGAYIDSDGVILELHDMKPFDETALEASSDRVQYVLEMNQGWFKKNGIGVGASISSERGAFKQAFFGQ